MPQRYFTLILLHLYTWYRAVVFKQLTTHNRSLFENHMLRINMKSYMFHHHQHHNHHHHHHHRRRHHHRHRHRHRHRHHEHDHGHDHHHHHYHYHHHRHRYNWIVDVLFLLEIICCVSHILRLATDFGVLMSKWLGNKPGVYAYV